ncbi:MAG: hypothetical protein GQ576_00430 [Methanococcoides sp.]|nr:hypothetical protein [Methanococcoides sp.]
MSETIELELNNEGKLAISKESKVSFYMDEESIFGFLKAIKNNKEIGDFIEDAPIGLDGVSDDFLVRLQSIY